LAGSELLGSDLGAAIGELRERHESIHVVGSVEFARSLVSGGLFDVLNLWVYPIVVGPGKRLFPENGPARGLRLLEPPVAGARGALLLRYGPGSDRVETAEMAEVDA
jgi:dihydrofolate reductase